MKKLKDEPGSTITSNKGFLAGLFRLLLSCTNSIRFFARSRSSDRRRHPRFRADREVKITCLDHANVSCMGKLRNLSAHGAGLALWERLPTDALIKVESDDIRLLGRLIHCQPKDREFIAGMDLKGFIFKAELASIVSAWQQEDRRLAQKKSAGLMLRADPGSEAAAGVKTAAAASRR